MPDRHSCCVQNTCIKTMIIIYWFISSSLCLSDFFFESVPDTVIAVGGIFYVLGIIGVLVLLVQYIYFRCVRTPERAALGEDGIYI